MKKDVRSANILMLQNGWPIMLRVDAIDKIEKANLVLNIGNGVNYPIE